MNLPLFIARRYFFSRKKKNFINVISIISMLVVGIGTMSLIIVLSVFNGLEGLLRQLYSEFDPELIIESKEGKSFVPDEGMLERISEVEGIAYVTEVIEDNVLVKYKNAQRVVRMKGVSENFLEQDRLDRSIVYGKPVLNKGDLNYAIIGRGVQYDLSINPGNDFYTLQLYYPKNIRPGTINPGSLYQVSHVYPSAIFAVEKYYDENYVFVPLSFAEKLLSYKNRRNSLEVALTDPALAKKVRQSLSEIAGDQYTVRLGEELHSDLYKILKIEKLLVFVIFSLIIGIASINIYFSLTMLVIDKKRDISILSAQGADKKLIKQIFLTEGMIIAFSGAVMGLFIGLGISYVQQEFGLISMGMQTTIMEAYPVKIQFLDVFFTCLAIITITFLASVQPAGAAAKRMDPGLL